MGRPVVHFEIIGKDAKKLQDFYAKLFDWKIDANNPMSYGLVEPNEGGPVPGPGGGIGPSMDGRTFVTVYVQVVDLNETLKQAESLGGKAVMQPMEVPGGPTIAQFTDPEGNLIGLIKQ